MKDKIYRFMQGRYGVDQLNTFLIIICIICFLINLFVGNLFIAIIAYGLWFSVLFRTLSKNSYQRTIENNKYLDFFKPLSRILKLKLMNKQDVNNKYFSCPECKQFVRVPINRGKIVITCPSCTNKFEKRT